jgi:hypothetical protein
MNNQNPKRLLWLNNGWWWMRWQPYHPLITQRMAFNLKTKDLQEAKLRRDAIIKEWSSSSLARLAA